MQERVFKTVSGREFKTSKAREIKFIEAMEKAGIVWRLYSGRCMFGRYCPAAYTSSRDGVYEDDIIAAAHNNGVKKLARDNMGLDMVLYTG